MEWRAEQLQQGSLPLPLTLPLTLPLPLTLTLTLTLPLPLTLTRPLRDVAPPAVGATVPWREEAAALDAREQPADLRHAQQEGGPPPAPRPAGDAPAVKLKNGAELATVRRCGGAVGWPVAAPTRHRRRLVCRREHSRARRGRCIAARDACTLDCKQLSSYKDTDFLRLIFWRNHKFDCTADDT